MENVSGVVFTNQEVGCSMFWTLSNLNELRAFDIDDFAELFEIFVPSAHEIYLVTDDGNDCFAICETFDAVESKVNELVSLFNSGQYAFQN